MKKTISIMLALLMLIGSMSMGVFALDEIATADPAQDVAAEGVEEDQEAVPEATEEDQAEVEEPVVEDSDSDEAAAEVTDEDQVDAEEAATAVEDADADAVEDAEVEEAAEPAEEEILDGEAVTDEPMAGTVDPAFAATATPTGKNGAVVSWTGSNDAKLIKVIVLKDGKATDTEVSAQAGATSATVTKLKDAGVYTFKVKLYDDTAGKTEFFSKNATGSIKILRAPKSVKTYSAYKSIALEWKHVKGAKGYKIYRDGKLIGTITDPDASRAYDSNKIAYIDKKDISDGSKEVTYKYKVAAYNDFGTSKKSAQVKDSAVRQMYIKFTLRTSRTLTSHEGKKKTHTFKAGSTFYAIGYGMGKYHFTYTINGKEYLYFVNYMSVRNPQALYTQKFNYSTKEAEYFANTCKQKSDTKYMIWANLYTQHVFIFKGSKGKWRINKTLKYKGKVYNSWECSSGQAITPSPWGMDLKFHGKLTNLYNKKRSFPGHGASLWNFYHSETALHGPAGNTGYGQPHSHGCIRNPLPNALFIFEKIPKKTRVVVF